jgi:hypothetical protein
MRFILGFGLSGVILAVLAARLAQHAAGLGWLIVSVEAYLAVCFMGLAIIYALRAAGEPVEDISRQPGWSLVIRMTLLPYFAIGGLALYLARAFDREGLLNCVAPGLFIGRLPFPFERGQLRAAGIKAVLNLCWEFPRGSRLDGETDPEAVHLPILDGSAPTDWQFREAVEWVGRWRAQGRSILIHCAQGHGRTATIAAAVLVQLGLAADLEQALAAIRAVRPLARPSRPQKAALIRYLSKAQTPSEAPIQLPDHPPPVPGR